MIHFRNSAYRIKVEIGIFDSLPDRSIFFQDNGSSSLKAGFSGTLSPVREAYVDTSAKFRRLEERKNAKAHHTPKDG